MFTWILENMIDTSSSCTTCSTISSLLPLPTLTYNHNLNSSLLIISLTSNTSITTIPCKLSSST